VRNGAEAVQLVRIPARDFEHLSREWRGELWFLSLLTYQARVVGQEGTAVDVAGTTNIDVDGSSSLRRVFAPNN
jgi:hypothetical protein